MFTRKVFLWYAHRWARAYAAMVLLMSLWACSSTPTPTPLPATLRVAATDLTAPLLGDLTAAYASIAPQVAFSLTTASPASIAADLEAGRVDVGLLVTRAPDYFATPVGYVRFVIVSHPNNPLADLTLTQTQAIFTGQLTDWAQVGIGAGGTIQVVSRADESEAGQAFNAAVLDGQLPARTALVAPTWAAMREAVGEDANALGYLPSPELDSSVKPLLTDDHLRALIVAAAVQEPEGAAHDFLAWAQSAAGQAVVGQRYDRINP